MSSIGVLLNLKAGPLPSRGYRLRRRLRGALDERFTIVETEEIDDLPAAVDRMMKEKVKMLCVCGGDGTLHHLLSFLLPRVKGEEIPPLLPLPTGTMNNVAKTLGLSGRPAAILRRAAAACEDPGLPTVKLNTLRVNERYGFIFSVGFPVGLLEDYYRRGGRGKGRAFLAFLRAVYSPILGNNFYRETFKYLDWELTLDGRRVSLPRFNAVLCGTIGALGCGLNPTYRWREREDRFHALVSSVSPRRMLLKLPRLMLGMPPGNGVWDVLGRKLVLSGPSPLKYLVDGEIYREGSRVTVELGPAVPMIRV